MTDANKIKAVAQSALPHAARLLNTWLPNGDIQGEEYVARNPTRDDHNPGSFKVNIKTGLWCDFATDDKGGDLVSLFAYLNNISQVEAARDVAEQLGMTQGESQLAQQSVPGVKNKLEWKIITPIPTTAGQTPFHPRLGKPSQMWAYRDRDGQVIGFACRFDLADSRKVILPLTYWKAANGTRRWQQWRWKAFPKPRPLYALDHLAAQPHAAVLVVEGEKTAGAAQFLFPQFVTVTSPGGCKSVEKADWSPLAGRRVIISPDFDDDGRKYSNDVAKIARKIGAASVELLVWPYHLKPENGNLVLRDGKPRKGYDLADAVLEGWTTEMVAERSDLFTPYPQPGEHPDPTTLLQRLSKESSPDELESVLREFVQTFGKSDKLKIAILRDKAIRHLKELQIKRATALVDAAIGSISNKSEDNEEQGTGICFPEINPWPDPVDGAELMDELASVLSKFVVLPPHAVEAVALWIIHTHAIDAAFISPILALLSPEKRCGKTTILKILSVLVLRCIFASNITPAALFRAIEMYGPTLLVDEADTFLAGNEDLRGVINAGHSRSGAFVIRTVGDSHEPRGFSVWGPKAIALIGRLPSTIEDRSISIRMHRKAPSERVARLREDQIGQECNDLQRKCARWVKDHLQELEKADPQIPEELNDRASDNWRPLLAIADEAGGPWPAKAQAAAMELSGEGNSQDDSIKVQLLSDLRDLFAREDADRLSSEMIVSRLQDMEERPWPEWKNGKPITKRQVARLLKSFGVVPKNLKFKDGKVLKGYVLEDFHDVFSRYLPFQSATALPGLIDKDLEQNRSATEVRVVADENRHKPLSNNDGSAVADWEGEKGDFPTIVEKIMTMERLRTTVRRRRTIRSDPSTERHID